MTDASTALLEPVMTRPTAGMTMAAWMVENDLNTRKLAMYAHVPPSVIESWLGYPTMPESHAPSRKSLVRLSKATLLTVPTVHELFDAQARDNIRNNRNAPFSVNDATPM